MKRFVVVQTVLVLIWMLAACQSSQEREPVVLKLYGVYEEFFAPGYKDRFEEEYPHIDVEILPYEYQSDGDPVLNLKSRIREHTPDIVFTGTTTFVGAIEEGLLLPLDPYIEESGFPLDTMPNAVVQKLRQEGDGQIYGLAPEFSSAALFFNKTLFQQYQVELPKDGMSWQGLFDLAARFPQVTEDGAPFWGFLSPGQQDPEKKLYYLIKRAGKSENLTIVDVENDTVTLQTPAWQNIWNTFVQAYRGGLISNMEYEELHPDSNLAGIHADERYASFLNGQAAMVVGENELLNLAIDQESLDFGLVTPPGTYQIYLQNTVFNITRESAHPEEAWTFISFALSDEMAKHKLGIDNVFGGWRNLPARITHLEQKLNHDLSAFYKQDAAHSGIYSLFSEIPTAFIIYERDATLEELKLVLAEEKTVVEAITDLQAKLEVAWREMR